MLTLKKVKIQNTKERNKTTPLHSIEAFADTLEKLREEIETKIINDLITAGNEYVCKCEGVIPVDPAEINELVTERDKDTLKFFGLENATESELST